MITAHVAYAYTRRQGAMSNGAHHAVVDGPMAEGRLRRAAGDALCHPRNRFWGLSRDCNSEAVTCAECRTRVESYGVVLTDPRAPAVAAAQAAENRNWRSVANAAAFAAIRPHVRAADALARLRATLTAHDALGDAGLLGELGPDRAGEVADAVLPALRKAGLLNTGEET